MKIKVTDKHIADGECEHPHKCPIALALNDIFFDEAEVWSGSNMTIRHVGGLVLSIQDQSRCNDFIALFDFGETVQPFEFEAELEEYEE